MYLLDTNIILEILLRQSKSADCQQWVAQHADQVFLSDCSLFSLGVVLFRQRKPNLFQDFLNDMLPITGIVRLPDSEFGNLQTLSESTGLDFDDTMQLSIARSFGFTLVTLDRDFQRIANATEPMIQIRFI
ncbi:MAG: PIN domain-containing protein [Candidatus Hydrogenedens sp.]|nr:PIN domain-containing protein [Candidatus Hydrogenedens sp.]